MQLQAIEQKITNCCASIQAIHMWICKTNHLQRSKISPYSYRYSQIILQVGFG